MNYYKAEIEVEDDGRVFLCIDANLTPEDEIILNKDGWKLLNNGTKLLDGTPAFYFYKTIIK